MTNVFLQAEIRIILPGFEVVSGLSAAPASAHFYHVMKNNKYHSKHALGKFPMNSI